MMNDIEKRIEIAGVITRKLLAGEEVTEREELLLGEWLDASEEHRAWFREYTEGLPYKEFERIVRLSDQDVQWQKLDHLTRKRRSIDWKRWGVYAAGVALLLSFGLWLGLHREGNDRSVMKVAGIVPGTTRALLVLDNGQKIELMGRDTLVNTALSSINVQAGQVKYEVKESTTDVVEYNTIEVPCGGIYSLVLSDGTKVFLNSDSKLRYPVKFGAERRDVELCGEAFFEVTRDSLRPFIVQTGEMRTRVLGTSFDVSAYPDEPVMRTTLLTGRVEVSVNDSPLKEILVAGTQANWNVGTDRLSVKKINVEIQSLWRDGIIVMDDDELDDVMRMLSRWYNVAYEFKSEQNVKHTFTGRINRNEDLESVLKTLTLLGGPRFEIVGTTVYIY